MTGFKVSEFLTFERLMLSLVILIGMLVLFGVVTKENVLDSVSAMTVFMLVVKEFKTHYHKNK